MSTDVAYLDTSAFVKLLVEEPESLALRRSLSAWQRFASSVILRTETLRALRRSGRPDLVGAARQLFSTMHLITLDVSLLDRAGEMAPDDLRTLDAIHVVSSLALGADLGEFFTYDQRLAEAARYQGLPVASPS
jgi:predicted nucleic acid-binding protein